VEAVERLIPNPLPIYLASAESCESPTSLHFTPTAGVPASDRPELRAWPGDVGGRRYRSSSAPWMARVWRWP